MPVNVGTELVPAAVSVCVCVPSAEPVKVSAGTVPALPVNVGAEFVPTGVKAAVLLVPAGVSIWVCVLKALPVKVGVWAMALATPPVVLESAPVVRALMVPAGVPPLVPLVT